jgi:endonuclease/exonuclease/phosphatase family metal-dependent hydrolase
MKSAVLSFLLLLLSSPVFAQLTLVELNCENLFDIRHDEGKDDMEFTPEGQRRWTKTRYWRKLNHIGQEILSCSEELPAMVVLVEVENDSVLRDLTRRSLLRGARYDYLMTESSDVRGLDIAWLYQPDLVRPLCYETVPVTPLEGMRPTRDILYVRGRVVSGDTLHVYVVHAPSRYGGERYSRPFRQAVARRLCQSLDSLHAVSPDARVLVAGDFNDDADGPALRQIEHCGVRNLTRDATGQNGAHGTYRYEGEWGSIDHVFGSSTIVSLVDSVFIHAPRFLLEKEPRYGGFRPRRTYQGMQYQPGYSDHLPLVVRLRLNDSE